MVSNEIRLSALEGMAGTTHGDASGSGTVHQVRGEPELHTELLRANYTCQGLLAWRQDRVAVGDTTRRGIFVARGVEMCGPNPAGNLNAAKFNPVN